MIGLKPNHDIKMMTESLGCLILILLSKWIYFGGRLMVLNVQITMTNVLGWSCLIHDVSIHSEKETCIQAKGNNIL